MHCGEVTVICYSESKSSLTTTIMENFLHTGISLISFSQEEQLWSWLYSHPSRIVAYLIVAADKNIEYILSHSNSYANIHSILIRCSNDDLVHLKPLSRIYLKINGIYSDDARVLLKLTIGLALLFEQMGDHQREVKGIELEAQRNYQLAVNFCALAKRL